MAIVVNTILLALVYDGMSEELTNALTNANYALTAVFTIEMLLKLAGLGFWDYIQVRRPRAWYQGFRV